ncbi:MAG: His-Xaa-Ser system radical SAM maturase HxsB [Elusimicrobia bacterium]|nr:MAG: His-Xaa-Ser system radical SAM maturase HxsB [Elusimicrobiota bacterium]
MGKLEKLIQGKLPEHVGPCYFRRLGEGWLLTNDWGRHARLSDRAFSGFFSETPERGSAWWRELEEKGFVRGRLDFPDLAARFARANSFLWSGPRLHVVVVTTRCDYACVYCQAGAPSADGADMSLDTAGRVVDFVFASPSPVLTIEFQGGEPLSNPAAIELIVSRARAKAREQGRNLRLALVSNLSLLDDARLDFLMENRVSVCTSLDGPAGLHDRNRPWTGGSSHAVVERWLKRAAERYPDAQGERYPRPNALMTVTRASLGRPEDIVDEYARLGLDNLFARPLTPLGSARKTAKAIGYAPEEYLAFYERLLERVLALNARGVRMRERGAGILLAKILHGTDPGFTDLRSPCGAAVGQLAYDHDGDVYTCDEGRMLAAEGDRLFRIGNVRETSYEDAVRHPTTKACQVASHLEGQPLCAHCAYRPYCGVCPAYNYAAQDTIWGRMGTNDRCAVYMGVFDLLFKRLEDPAARKVLEEWGASAAGCGPECRV